MKNDNLFDKKWTFLDTLKIFFLLVSAFSTWNIVDLLTPDTSLAFVREFAALAIVEGTFIGFEAATWKAKNKQQVKIATVGFFASITVIGLFAATSSVLEFGGADMLTQPAGSFLGMNMTVRDAVSAASMVVFVTWLVTLASLFRIYELNDPDKKIQIAEISENGRVDEEGITALGHAINKTKNVVARERARARIINRYGGELTPEQLDAMMQAVDDELATHYDAPSKPIPADQVLPIRNFRMDAEHVAAARASHPQAAPRHTVQTEPKPTPVADWTWTPTVPPSRPAPSVLNEVFKMREENSRAWAQPWAKVGDRTVGDVIRDGNCVLPQDGFAEDMPMDGPTAKLIAQVQGENGLPCASGYGGTMTNLPASVCQSCGFHKQEKPSAGESFRN